MKMLQQTAPEVYQGFQEGDFVTKETTNQFNQIPDDQALEHVNRAGKVAGGLVGITRSDVAYVIAGASHTTKEHSFPKILKPCLMS